MKKILFALAISVVGIISTENALAQEIKFEKEVHDYGTVNYGGDGSATFKFKNTGKAPLIISHAGASCGCTVPDWPKTPIAPGKSSSITVKYDTKRPGPIDKTITVTSNAVNAPNKILKIKGSVKSNS